MNLDALMDTPRIYTALAEWGACILYVLLLRRKVTGWKLPVSLAGSLLVFIAYQEFAGTLPIYFWIPFMIGAAFLMCLLLHLLCDTTWLDAGFCCAQALVLAEFTASFHWQLYVWWALNYAKNSRLFSALTMLILYTGIYIGYYFLERGHFPTDERLLVNGKELLKRSPHCTWSICHQQHQLRHAKYAVFQCHKFHLVCADTGRFRGTCHAFFHAGKTGRTSYEK